MPTETDLLILAAELDRSDSEARAYALSHDADRDALDYVRHWAARTPARDGWADVCEQVEGN